MRRSFTYNDRLKSSKTIARVFETGGQLFQYPIKIFYLCQESRTGQVQMAVSVPKKKFKKATDRNIVKRRMREAFRLNRAEAENGVDLATMWVYIGKEIEPYEKIESATRKLWQKLNNLQIHGPETQQEGH